MKKTLFLLLALAGTASAKMYEFTSCDILIGSDSSLSSGNQTMSWNGTDAYTELNAVTLATTGVAGSTVSAEDTYVFAVSETVEKDYAVTVNDGSTGTKWAAAFGNNTNYGTDDDELVLTGNVSMSFTDNFTGANTVFGAVNTGSVSGEVALVFDAENATYGSFTKESTSTSIAGAYNSSIGGTFSATINAGTFNYDIVGGVHTGNNDYVGAVDITVNGGVIEGNVYAGGYTGSITGDTSVTITSLEPFSTHTADNIISAGGLGGTISGDSSVTFSGIASGSYAGTVSGGDNVAGTSVLSVENSTLSLMNVTGFDQISVGEGSELTINGDTSISIIGNSAVTVSYDTTDAASRTSNGLGAALVSGYVTGNGTFLLGESATINGKEASVQDTATGTLSVADSIYYIVSPAGGDDEAGYAYSVDGQFTGEYSEQGNPILVDRKIKSGDVVYVGVHTYPGPIANDDANNALGFYVGKEGILGILSDSNTMTAGQILTQAQGDGTIILRAPGTEDESDEQGIQKNFEAYISGKTQFTGALYTDPKLINGSNVPTGTKSVELCLSEGADISSFSSINVGNNVHFEVNGALSRANDTIGHFNNVTGIGSATTNFNFNIGSAGHYVFGGDTKLNLYWFGTDYPDPDLVSGATIVMRFLDDVTVDIEHLTSEGTFFAGDREPHLQLTNGDLGSRNEVLNGNPDYASLNFDSIVNIDSFDFRGSISMYTRHEGSLHVNLNLLEDQYLLQSQYVASQKAGGTTTPSMTLMGTGTYILTAGNSLLDNVGRVSEASDTDGNRIWQGTVEVNNLVALDKYDSGTTKNGFDFDDYGNEQSTVHFKGFNGYLYANDGYMKMDVVQDLILTNTDTMNAYEISNGFSSQVQNYEGDISGTGDFVVSASTGMTYNFKGDLSGWKDGAELKVSAGTQTVNFTDKATEINADVVTTGGTMNVSISNTEEVTVNGKVSNAGGGALNLTVETDAGTTFNNTVNVTSLTVGDNAEVKLAKTSTIGSVQIDARGAGVAELSKGMTITDSSLSNGHIRNAAITSISPGTVELDGITAENLYLYGEDVDFLSTEDEAMFYFDEVVDMYNHTVNVVKFSSDVFKGMTLGKDGAGITLSVSNTVDWGNVGEADMTNVIIYLEGFTIEGLTSGIYDESSFALQFAPSEVATLSDSLTVADLLAWDYAIKTYSQTASGLTISLSNIPEPTSATLSLLALAALAARRRRK